LLTAIILSVVAPVAAAVLSAVEDREFVERLKRQEPDAAGELYDRYGRLVYSLILRMVRNQAVAEEILQEAFLRVWHRAKFFDAERGGFAAWMLAVARNQAIDYLRSVSGRQWKGEVAMSPMDEPALYSDLAQDLVQAQHAKRVRTAMGKLEDNQRTVIELAYFEGLSQSEIAARLSQPLGTVKTWTRSALKFLRAELGELVTT